MKIDAYSFGHIKIGQKLYNHDVIIFGENVFSWWRKIGHKVLKEDIKDVVERFTPSFIIFGTGASGCMSVDEEVKEYLGKKGIKFYEAPTPEAVKKFNELKEDAMAALHLTC